MARYTDLMEFKNDKVRAEIIRERIGKCIYTALCVEFGADFVRLMSNETICPTGDSTEQKFPKNSLVVDVGDITDKDGFERGALINISAKVLSWNDVRTAKTDRTALTFDDVLDGIEKAEKLAVAKAEKAQKSAEAKAKKIERDRKFRESKGK